jgi:hypothetical protein
MPFGMFGDWHTNCFEKVSKEMANEKQDEREGWLLVWRRTRLVSGDS